jgi:hypothetical protein
MDANVLKSVPEIIKAASGTNLGILALLVLVLALFGFYFFRKSGVRYQFAVFVLMFFGVAAFGYAAIAVQREDAMRAANESARRAAEAIPDLRLSLLFPEKEAAKPSRAHVSAFVVRKATGVREPLPDVQPHSGPGGIYLDFKKLAVGDIVSVEVEDRGKKWQSYDMPMLTANLEMLEEQ